MQPLQGVFTVFEHFQPGPKEGCFCVAPSSGWLGTILGHHYRFLCFKKHEVPRVSKCKAQGVMRRCTHHGCETHFYANFFYKSFKFYEAYFAKIS